MNDVTPADQEATVPKGQTHWRRCKLIALAAASIFPLAVVRYFIEHLWQTYVDTPQAGWLQISGVIIADAFLLFIALIFVVSVYAGSSLIQASSQGDGASGSTGNIVRSVLLHVVSWSAILTASYLVEPLLISSKDPVPFIFCYLVFSAIFVYPFLACMFDPGAMDSASLRNGDPVFVPVDSSIMNALLSYNPLEFMAPAIAIMYVGLMVARQVSFIPLIIAFAVIFCLPFVIALKPSNAFPGHGGDSQSPVSVALFVISCLVIVCASCLTELAFTPHPAWSLAFLLYMELTLFHILFICSHDSRSERRQSTVSTAAG